MQLSRVRQLIFHFLRSWLRATRWLWGAMFWASLRTNLPYRPRFGTRDIRRPLFWPVILISVSAPAMTRDSLLSAIFWSRGSPVNCPWVLSHLSLYRILIAVYKPSPGAII